MNAISQLYETHFFSFYCRLTKGKSMSRNHTYMDLFFHLKTFLSYAISLSSSIPFGYAL
jgi:hypothetical protein